MWTMKTHDRAISEGFSVIIICILVAVAAVLLTASLTGVITNMLQKPALFSVQAVPYNNGALNIVGIFHQEGDAVNLKGTTQSEGSSIVSMVLIDNTGTERPVKAGTIRHDAWEPGNMLYIYQSGDYWYTDDVSTAAGILASGTYTVKITDDKAKVLIHTLSVTLP